MTRAAPTCTAPQSFAASCEERTPLIAALAAEGAILGTLMVVAGTDEEAQAWLVLEDLGANQFFSEANEWVYSAACELAFEGESPDAVSLADWLRTTGRMRQVGGAAYLAELMEMSPVIAAVPKLEGQRRAVQDAYERRTLAGRCAEAIARLRCGEAAASVAAGLSRGGE